MNCSSHIACPADAQFEGTVTAAWRAADADRSFTHTQDRYFYKLPGAVVERFSFWQFDSKDFLQGGQLPDSEYPAHLGCE
jgi:hypothetical protein